MLAVDRAAERAARRFDETAYSFVSRACGLLNEALKSGYRAGFHELVDGHDGGEAPGERGKRGSDHYADCSANAARLVAIAAIHATGPRDGERFTDTGDGE